MNTSEYNITIEKQVSDTRGIPYSQDLTDPYYRHQIFKEELRKIVNEFIDNL